MSEPGRSLQLGSRPTLSSSKKYVDGMEGMLSPSVRIIAVSMPERPRLPARPFDLACSIRLETRLHSTD